MGITYRAQDLTLGSLVALKVISVRYSEDLESRDRFAAKRARLHNCGTLTSLVSFILVKPTLADVSMRWN